MMGWDASTLQGLWFMKVRLVDVGGLETAFQVEIEASESTLTKVVFRAYGAGMISEDLTTLNDIEIDADGKFTLPLTGMILPAMFSPSGSQVELDLTLSAQASDLGFCGGIMGSVVTLEIPLMSSTFASVPWDDREGMTPASCEDGSATEIPRIETCPVLTDGENTIESGGYMRMVKIITPSYFTPEMTWPLVTLWHGFTSNVDEIQEYAQMNDLVESEGFVLAVPSSRGDAGLEWDSLSADDSPDLAFFDDLVKCTKESFSIDPQRVHVTGFSGGGLWSAYLSVFRSEVVASTVGMSSGLIPDYPDPEQKIPYLAAWGGDEDIAYDQDFVRLAGSLIEAFLANGHFVVSCDHGQEHNWDPEFSSWVIRFLIDHPKNIEGIPYAEGLPTEEYPDYCEIPTP
jgi:predicted esterase